MNDAHRPTLLAIFAHPDDESFGPGGTLARYAAEGVDVHICIVTDGDAGSTDEEHLEGYESLAHRREGELQRAVAVLGATLHRMPYRDSGMAGDEANHHPASLAQAPLDGVACRVVALIHQVRPHVIITHDPTGGYFHPDHIKVNQAVLHAWELLSDVSACHGVPVPRWMPDRLFYTVIPQKWIRVGIFALRLFRKDPTRIGRNADIDLTRLGTPDDLIHTRVDVRAFLDRKREASAQHVSQGGGAEFIRMPRFLQERFFGTELFSQAYPPQPVSSDDLFAGLR